MPNLQRALVRDAGNDFREREPDGQRRQQKDKPGHGSGHADVEQHALGIDRRADANEGAERSRERGRRQEVRQAGIHAVIHAGDVVAELVSQQDGEQRERERQPLQQESRMMPPGQ